MNITIVDVEGDHDGVIVGILDSPSIDGCEVAYLQSTPFWAEQSVQPTGDHVNIFSDRLGSRFFWLVAWSWFGKS